MSLPSVEEPESTSQPAPSGTMAKISDFLSRVSRLVLGGGHESLQKQRDKGKLTARERVSVLLDPESFLETDLFIEQAGKDFGLAGKQLAGRRSGNRLRPDQQSAGGAVCPGLHGRRRLPRPGSCRQDREGHGLRPRHARPADRHQRLRRGQDPGRSRLPLRVWRDLLPEHPRSAVSCPRSP